VSDYFVKKNPEEKTLQLNLSIAQRGDNRTAGADLAGNTAPTTIQRELPEKKKTGRSREK